MAGSARDSSSPFVAYHRARRASALGRAVIFGTPVAMLFAGMCILASLTTAQAAAASSIALPAIDAGPTATPTPTPSITPSVKASAAGSRVTPGPSVVHIDITATGYQRELDECRWVRMDLNAEAPIVGAHTRCGGSVVLQLRPGEVVELRGQSLDGRYVVTDSRDAHAGDDAATATAGMQAQVILQSCYSGSGGRERLVGLEPQG